MTQYLLSVHMVEGEAMPAPEVIEKMYKDVDTFNNKLQAQGSWVFAGGLHPANTATVVRVKDGEVAHQRWSVRRVEGAARRLLGRRMPPTSTQRWRWQLRVQSPAAAPVEVRPFQDEPES